MADDACGGPPGTWVYQACAAASLAFLCPRFAHCAVWFWGEHPGCGLCVAGLVQPPGGRYGQMVVKTHQEGFSESEREWFSLVVDMANWS